MDVSPGEIFFGNDLSIAPIILLPDKIVDPGLKGLQIPVVDFLRGIFVLNINAPGLILIDIDLPQQARH